MVPYFLNTFACPRASHPRQFCLSRRFIFTKFVALLSGSVCLSQSYPSPTVLFVPEVYIHQDCYFTFSIRLSVPELFIKVTTSRVILAALGVATRITTSRTPGLLLSGFLCLSQKYHQGYHIARPGTIHQNDHVPGIFYVCQTYSFTASSGCYRLSSEISTFQAVLCASEVFFKMSTFRIFF